MAGYFGIGFVSALTQHLNQALAQVQQQQLQEQSRKMTIANLLVKSGMEKGGTQGAEEMAAGWTVLLDPKADINKPEKSKAWQQAMGIAHLTPQMDQGPPGDMIQGSTPQDSSNGEGGPRAVPTPATPPPVDLSGIMSQDSSQQPSGNPLTAIMGQNQSTQPGGPSASLNPPPSAAPPSLALPSTSPTTGGPGLNLSPATSPTPPTPTAASPGAATPAGSPAPGSTPATTIPKTPPPPGSQPDPGWYAVKKSVDEMLAAARNANPSRIQFEEGEKRAAIIHSMINDAYASHLPVTDENLQRIFDELHPVGARIQATKEATTARGQQAERMLQLKQQGTTALELLKEANKQGKPIELSDEQAKAVGLPSGGFVDPRLFKELESNYRANISAGARVKSAGISASGAGRGGVTKYEDANGDVWWVSKDEAATGQLADREHLRAPTEATTHAKMEQGKRILMLRDDLFSQLKQPEVRDVMQRALNTSTLANLADYPDPKVTEFMGSLESWLAMQPALHQFRGNSAVERFSNFAKGNVRSAENLEAAIRGLSKASQSWVQPGGRPSGSKVAPPPGATSKGAKAPTSPAFDPTDPLGYFKH